MTGRVALVFAMAAARVARADAVQPAPAPAGGEADPAVQEASDANLESTGNRSGMTLAASLGGGLIIGFGIKDSVGRGPALTLRLGHVATRRTVTTLELGVTTALHQPKGGSIETDRNVNVMVGAQYYVNPSLWLRGAGGLGIYQAQENKSSIPVVGMPTVVDLSLMGPAALVGIGLEVARFKWAVLGFETATSAMINRDGVLVASQLNLGLAFD